MMLINGQKTTAQFYEDVKVVDGYIKRNTLKTQEKKNINKFSQLIKNGGKVLDLGCGPGRDSYAFFDLGFDVVGLDFSSEMIKRAEDLKKAENQPKFLVGDMNKLNKYFIENEFDAIWANASLLHIRRDDLPSVLQGIKKITKNNGYIWITLKNGEGRKIVEENKYGKKMNREFIFWDKDEFIDFSKQYGLVLQDYFSTKSGSSKSYFWHNFIFVVKK